jgi:potassium-transporting ATPase KdpC subunit
MLTELKRGVLFTAVTIVLFGVVYHLAIWGIGRTLFPVQAEGSLIRRADGTITGSRLIAQKFTRPEYFHPRPSAVDYNAASAGGSNLGPTNPDHLKTVKERLDAVVALEHVSTGEIPSEMVTAAGSGLDPDIPPEAAEIQTARVARARNVSTARVGELMRAHTEAPMFGFLGRSRINVLELNLALDESLGKGTAAPAITR